MFYYHLSVHWAHSSVFGFLSSSSVPLTSERLLQRVPACGHAACPLPAVLVSCCLPPPFWAPLLSLPGALRCTSGCLLLRPPSWCRVILLGCGILRREPPSDVLKYAVSSGFPHLCRSSCVSFHCEKHCKSFLSLETLGHFALNCCLSLVLQ